MNERHVHEVTFGDKAVRFSLPSPNDLIQRRLREGGQFYESEMLAHARHLIRPGACVVDVGANIGNHTLFFACVCGARVFAFEPHPESAACLRENMRLNELADQVAVFEIGLGDQSGKANIQCADPANQGAAQLDVSEGGDITVRAYDELGLEDEVALVKVDVENMERVVLQGMSGMLAKCRPVLYVEIQDSAQVGLIQSDLDALGYGLVECFNSTPTYCFMPIGSSDQRFEALMARLDAALRMRVRAQSVSLDVDARGPLADKLPVIRQGVDQLRGKLPVIGQRLDEVREMQRRIDFGEVEARLDRLEQAVSASANAVSKPLRSQLDTLLREVDRLRLDVRHLNRSRILPKLVALVLRPRKVLASVWRRLFPKPVRKDEPTKTAPDMSQQLVTVVMTSYNSSGLIEAAVRSILAQTHRKLELIVVDDASTDDTVELLGRIRAEDDRLRVVRSHVNRGTYWAKNLGILHARGSYVTLQDSDDVSDPKRIQRQLELLAPGGPKVASTCNYVRVDDGGNVVLNRGLRERLGLITLMFEREVVLDRIGFFDSVRTSADAEFLARLRQVFSKSALAHVDEPLYVAKVRDGSLSNKSVELGGPGKGTGFLSADRQSYVRAYEGWHASDSAPFVPFPLRSRPFDAPPKMLRNCAWREDRVTVSLASIPSRESGLKRVVASLLGQVDQLNVYLNNYDSVPDFLSHPKIRVERSQEHGDLRDNGKFFFLEEADEGYYLTVDDDIAYPANYVSYLIAKLRQYGDRVIAGFHGTIMSPQQERFFDVERRTVLSFKRELLEDSQTHLLGTGTTAWHTTAIKLTLDDFETQGMADLWLAVRAQQQDVPMMAVARPDGYLAPFSDLEKGSLFEEFVHQDDEQTRIFRAQSPWTFPSLAHTVVQASDG